MRGWHHRHEEICKNMVMNSIGIITALNPILGYEESSSTAKGALATGKSIYQITVLERRSITQEKWDKVFSVENLLHPKFIID